jgi:hypothetical protein
MACATANTRSEAMTPRTKMSCIAGIVWLAYLTSESLTMKHAIAPTIATTPMRVARACEDSSSAALASAATRTAFALPRVIELRRLRAAARASVAPESGVR